MHAFLRHGIILVACWALSSPCLAENAGKQETGSSTVRFRKQVLTDDYYCDGIASGDINRDGKLDVIAGPFWWAGPAFTERHPFYPPEVLPPERSPSNSMFSFVHDFNGDDWPDILVLGRVHLHPAYWYENPGMKDTLWKKHFVFERVRGESPMLVDLDQDGQPQLICHWNGRWGWIAPDDDPYKPWRFQPVETEDKDWPQFYHGQGVGDLNGDGRLDLIINDGWFEQPKKVDSMWPFHPQRFSSGRGGAQIFTNDVDADGDADVLTALDAHGWGLAWFEQRGSATESSFEPHLVMGNRSEEEKFGVAFSQPHALTVADIDGDGLQDWIVGKRRWAHGPQGDVEPNAAPVVYWFQLQRTASGQARYVPHLIDAQSGVGVQIEAVDINQDGRVDILTTSKLGVFVFLQE